MINVINSSQKLFKILSLTLLLTENFLLTTVLCDNINNNDSNDYYQLLGVSRDADNREIRKAFKKLALTLHPDKNVGDNSANEKFLKINSAYEVLKDEETRKTYDTYGEEGLKDNFGRHSNYHSWNYYYEDFGIYDNDEEIVTLSRVDFEQSVQNSPFIWFINFYSPQCSHCHQLAPNWRKLAKELENVIRIGAINCEDEWQLCRQESVRSYPSLILYPDRERYNGVRDTDALVEFVLNKLPNRLITVDSSNVKTFHLSPQNDGFVKPLNYWLLLFCFDNTDCLFDDTKKKLSIMLDGITNVADIKCDTNDKTVCDYFNIYESKTVLLHNIIDDRHNYFEITSSDSSIDAKEIFVSVLTKLPNIKKLSHKELKSLLDASNAQIQPSIICFTTTDKETETIQIELKRLSSLMPEVNIAKVFCDKEPKSCSLFYIQKYPTFVVLKTDSNYEIYHGRICAYDIATFAKESLSSQMQTLDPIQFEDKISAFDKPLLVDFFAPWCPPCMSLLPEIRKASRTANHLVNFGTIDCTIHATMCRQYNIRSYPTLLLYNSSIPHQFYGSHSEYELIDFIHDTLWPAVINLDENSFRELVENRKEKVLWIIDFYAPWCGPCQQLSPQWRKLAKILKEEPIIKVGQIDCPANKKLCARLGIDSYPTIRLYPTIKASNQYDQQFYTYQGHSRDVSSLRVWTYNYIPSVVKDINTDELFAKVLNSKNVWLIDYYAPWCGHCQTFAPEFEIIAKKLKGEVKAGKVNCQTEQNICREARVTAYPTVKLYTGSKNGVKQNAGGVYVDGYNSNDVIEFVLNYLALSISQNVVKDEL